MADLAQQLVGTVGADEGVAAAVETAAEMAKKASCRGAWGRGALSRKAAAGGGALQQTSRAGGLQPRRLQPRPTRTCFAPSALRTPALPLLSLPLQWEYKEEELGQPVHAFTVRIKHKWVGGCGCMSCWARLRALAGHRPACPCRLPASAVLPGNGAALLSAKHLPPAQHALLPATPPLPDPQVWRGAGGVGGRVIRRHQQHAHHVRWGHGRACERHWAAELAGLAMRQHVSFNQS